MPVLRDIKFSVNRDEIMRRQMKASQLFRIEQGDFVYTRLFASKGTFALIGEALDGCHASSEFPCFQINVALVEPQTLERFLGKAVRVIDHRRLQE